MILETLGLLFFSFCIGLFGSISLINLLHKWRDWKAWVLGLFWTIACTLAGLSCFRALLVVILASQLKHHG